MAKVSRRGFLMSGHRWPSIATPSYYVKPHEVCDERKGLGRTKERGVLRRKRPMMDIDGFVRCSSTALHHPVPACIC